MTLHRSHLSLLFTTIDGGGNVAPVMGLVARLVERGHSVRVMSDGASRDEVEAAGASFVSWTKAPNKLVRSRDSDPRDWEAPTAVAGNAATIEQFMCGSAGLYAHDVVAELRREAADLVVNFDMVLGVVTGCEALGQRVALLSTMISMFPIPGLPPFGFAMTPAQSESERAAIDAANAQLEGMYDAGLAPLNSARKSLGLPAVVHTLEQLDAVAVRWLGTARAFDFASRRAPSNLRYVGPLIRDPVDVEPWASPWRADDARPLVLVSFSTSFQGHIDCLQRAIDACSDLPVRVLVTLGHSVEPHEVRVGANTHVVRSAPHTRVMGEAALVITHGGHGTVMTALMKRLPLLVIPHGRDQGDNAVRIVHRGAGLSLGNRASKDEMRGAVRRLLDEPAFAEAARRLGDAIAEEVRLSCLIDEVESLARGHDQPTREDP